MGRITLDITPADGYRLARLTVNGQDVTGLVVNGQYTFTITEDTEIDAVFEVAVLTAYIDDTEEADHYPSFADALNSGRYYNLFYLGKDINEDISLSGLDKTLVLRSGMTLNSTITVTPAGESPTTVGLRDLKAVDDVTITFGSIHISGAVENGDLIVVQGNAVIDADTVFEQGMTLRIESGSTLSVSPGATLTI